MPRVYTIYTHTYIWRKGEKCFRSLVFPRVNKTMARRTLKTNIYIVNANLYTCRVHVQTFNIAIW